MVYGNTKQIIILYKWGTDQDMGGSTPKIKSNIEQTSVSPFQSLPLQMPQLLPTILLVSSHPSTL